MKTFIKTAGYFAFGIASCTIMACTAEEIAGARTEAMTPPPLVAEGAVAQTEGPAKPETEKTAAASEKFEAELETLSREANAQPVCKKAKGRRSTKVAARKGAKKGASRKGKVGKRVKTCPENI